jgi:hypothetical protein
VAFSSPTPRPTTAPTEAPTFDPRPLPTTTPVGWWGSDADAGYCGLLPARYRIEEGEVDALGACVGWFSDPPDTTIELAVGEDLDLHMAVREAGSPPIYPLPDSTDPIVVRGWLIADRATMTYRALAPGTARLVTTGFCFVKDGSLAGGHQFNGACPVLTIHVGKIETECGNVAVDVCRAVAADAVLAPFANDGRVVRWTIATTPYVDCTSLTVVQTFDVTLSYRDPDSKLTVSVGQRQPGSVDPGNFLVCTY